MSWKLSVPEIGQQALRGRVRKWLVAEGTQVKEGQEVVEIMLGDYNLAMEALGTGQLKIAIPAGGVIQSGDVLGTIEKETPLFFVHPTSVVDEPAQIGAGTHIWHFSHIMAGTQLGENCKLGQNVFVGKDVILGNNVKVQNNVSIYSGVTCEDDVFLGPSMVFTNVINPRSAVNRRGDYLKTHLERGVTVGANATIVCGVRLGKYAFVGAGTVVTKDVPAYALIVGNPGRQVGWMSEYGEKIEFDTEGLGKCPGSQEKYQLKNHRVTKIQ